MYVLEMVQEHTRMSKEGYSKKRMDLIVKVCIYLLLQRDKLYSEQKQARWLLVTSSLGLQTELCSGTLSRNKTKMKERTKLYSKARLQYRSVNARLRLRKDQLVLGLSA